MLQMHSARFAAALLILLAGCGAASAGWIDDDASGNDWIRGDIAVHVEQYTGGGAILTVEIADELVNVSAHDLFVRIPLQFARSTWPDGWVGPLEPTDENLWSHTHEGLTKTMAAYDSSDPGDEFIMMDITGVEHIRMSIEDPLFSGVWLDSPDIAPTWDLGIIPAGGTLEGGEPFGRILIFDDEGLWHIQGTTITSLVPEPPAASLLALLGAGLLSVRRRRG